ncbi:hypothetical protein JVT61DRAFT_12356 [Boletus reticuloceps]|uniref:Uncharacterized protein n=1 Tax=Boletus reticuloceps TaxID=495285 RepID=A0A8I2YE33_9AGAM|nr:hypothetical protein JVT61DRAFT_12356 [Boletus reticuloceps]
MEPENETSGVGSRRSSTSTVRMSEERGHSIASTDEEDLFDTPSGYRSPPVSQLVSAHSVSFTPYTNPTWNFNTGAQSSHPMNVSPPRSLPSTPQTHGSVQPVPSHSVPTHSMNVSLGPLMSPPSTLPAHGSVPPDPSRLLHGPVRSSRARQKVMAAPKLGVKGKGVATTGSSPDAMDQDTGPELMTRSSNILDVLDPRLKESFAAPSSHPAAGPTAPPTIPFAQPHNNNPTQSTFSPNQHVPLCQSDRMIQSGNSDSSGSSGVAPLLSYLSTTFDHFRQSLQKDQVHLQQSLFEQQKQLATEIASLRQGLGGQPNHPSNPISQSAGIPPRVSTGNRRANKKARHLIPGEGRDKANAQDNADYCHLLTYVRTHTLHLLGVADLKYINDVTHLCILTVEENEAFNREQPNQPVITAENFRIDLTRSRTTPFNREAIDVFANDFLQKLCVDKWYTDYDIPGQYLNVAVIARCFYDHLKYVKTMYVRHVTAPAKDQIVAARKEDERLQKGSRGSRKARLHKWRLEAITHDPTLQRHYPLLDFLGPQGMSSDESDNEATGPSLKYPRIYPSWRSKPLSALLWRTDPIVESIHRTPIGCRKIRGSQMRVRPHSKKCNSLAVAPPGLPRNCYDPDWVSKLSERQQKWLGMQQLDYDFGPGYP